MLWVANRALGLVLKHVYDIVDVQFDPSESERFKGLLGERVLLTPNHPTHAEPAVLFELSKRARKPFYYLSNREAFGFAWGLFGFVLQRCGAYSIIRGAADRESFKTTRRILSEPGNQLVIFPEGEVYSQNDSLLPFQAGVFQLTFLALEDMEKKGVEAPLYIQPVAIQYRFLEDMRLPIAESMVRLEALLGLSREPPTEPYPRLRRIADAVLSAAERTYNLPRGSIDDMNPRIDAVRAKIIGRVSDSMRIDPNSLGKTLPDRMRALMNRLTGVAPDDGQIESEYHQKLLREEEERNRPLIQDLRRLSNWLAVRDGYVGEKPTAERMVDTLWRLESEVAGWRMIRGKRSCTVRLPEPFDLREYRERYLADKREAVQAVTARVEAAIQRVLSG